MLVTVEVVVGLQQFNLAMQCVVGVAMFEMLPDAVLSTLAAYLAVESHPPWHFLIFSPLVRLSSHIVYVVEV